MNVNYYVTKDGYLLRTGSCPDDQISVQALAGEEVHEGDPPPGMPFPPLPQPPLAELKLWKHHDIRRAASIASSGGFTAATVQWDSDLAAQQRMQLAWQDMREADGPTTVQWYDANGTTRNLNAAQFKALCRALRTHLQAQQDKLMALRAQIDAATTVAELEAITW
jgi:hypothetical protein